MATDSKLTQIFNQIHDQLNEQLWFQQLKSKWEELDATQRFYTQVGVIGGVALLICITGLTFVIKVRSIKSELTQKTALRMKIQNASDELQRLRSSARGLAPADGNTWQATVRSLASQVGVDESTIDIGAEKPGSTGGTAKETLVDVKIKKINVKQLVRYAVQLETGSQPIKLRNLTINSEDPEGWLSASLALSVFELKKQ